MSGKKKGDYETLGNGDDDLPPQYDVEARTYPVAQPYGYGNSNSNSNSGYSSPYPTATPVASTNTTSYGYGGGSTNQTTVYITSSSSSPTRIPSYGTTSETEEDYQYSDYVSSCPQSVRMAFLRRVYLVLFFQIAVTCAICSIFMFVEGPQTWVADNYWIIWVNLILTIIVFVVTFVKRRQWPLNIILLTAFTVMEAFTIGFIVSYYATEEVMAAFFITMAVFFGITLFTFQTKWDFTWLGPVLMASLFGMMMASLLMWIWYDDVVVIIWCCFGVVIFTGLILFDTFLILKKYSPDEYIAASLSLYMDIINLFLFLLRLIGITRN